MRLVLGEERRGEEEGERERREEGEEKEIGGSGTILSGKRSMVAVGWGLGGGAQGGERTEGNRTNRTNRGKTGGGEQALTLANSGQG